MKLFLLAITALLSGCQIKTITKTGDGNMYLNGPAYVDYMDLGSDCGHLFKPPYSYYHEIYLTTNGYRITPDGLLHYGIMSSWKKSGLITK